MYSVNRSKAKTAARFKKFAETCSPLVPLARPEEFPNMTWDAYEKLWAKNELREVQE